MKSGVMAIVATLGVVSNASIARSVQFTAPHTPPSTTFVTVSGGNTCPKGTTDLYAGSSVIFRSVGTGSLTEDTRCWKTPPTSTTQIEVTILGPCIVCRFGR